MVNGVISPVKDNMLVAWQRANKSLMQYYNQRLQIAERRHFALPSGKAKNELKCKGFLGSRVDDFVPLGSVVIFQLAVDAFHHLLNDLDILGSPVDTLYPIKM